MAVRVGPPLLLRRARRLPPPMAGMMATFSPGRMLTSGRPAGAKPPRTTTSLRRWSQTRTATSPQGTLSFGSYERR
eukprot:351477-Alexandrium_andersonii.AAC.1